MIIQFSTETYSGNIFGNLTTGVPTKKLVNGIQQKIFPYVYCRFYILSINDFRTSAGNFNMSEGNCNENKSLCSFDLVIRLGIVSFSSTLLLLSSTRARVGSVQIAAGGF